MITWRPCVRACERAFFTYIWIPNIDTRGCMGSVTLMPAAPDHLRHHRIPERQQTNIDPSRVTGPAAHTRLRLQLAHPLRLVNVSFSVSF